jgi:hypothetical protein
MVLSVIFLPRSSVNWKLCCCHAIKKFYKQKCKLEPIKFAKCVLPCREESELHAGPSSFHCMCAHTPNVKLLFGIIWNVKTN